MPNTKKKPVMAENGEIDIFSRGDMAKKIRDATSTAPVSKVSTPAEEAEVAVAEKPAPTTQSTPKQTPPRTQRPVERKAEPKPKADTRKTSRVVKVPSENTQNVPLRFRIPSDLKGEWSSFMGELTAALGGVSLDDSNIGRPLIELLLVDYKDRILENAEAIKGTLRRPALADRLAMAEFDEEIGQVLKKSITQRKKRAIAE